MQDDRWNEYTKEEQDYYLSSLAYGIASEEYVSDEQLANLKTYGTHLIPAHLTPIAIKWSGYSEYLR